MGPEVPRLEFFFSQSVGQALELLITTALKLSEIKGKADLTIFPWSLRWALLEKCIPWHRTAWIKNDDEVKWSLLVHLLLLWQTRLVTKLCSLEFCFLYQHFDESFPGNWFKVMFSVSKPSFCMKSHLLQWYLHGRAHLISYRLPHC